MIVNIKIRPGRRAGCGPWSMGWSRGRFEPPYVGCYESWDAGAGARCQAVSLPPRPPWPLWLLTQRGEGRRMDRGLKSERFGAASSRRLAMGKRQDCRSPRRWRVRGALGILRMRRTGGPAGPPHHATRAGRTNVGPRIGLRFGAAGILMPVHRNNSSGHCLIYLTQP